MIPQGVSVGRIANIEIKVNLSLLIIAVIIAMTLSIGVLPAATGGVFSGFVYGIMGVAGAALFIGSILFHELAHSLLALHYRIPVVQIVLHLFGGLAQIARDPERPVQEFWIAIAGPISSGVLALGFGLLGAAFGFTSLPGAMFGWLSSVNITLAVFNLVPGFPLDGGRVLRAILWKITGSYRIATRRASRVGQGIAILFGVFGIGLILVTLNLFNGLWFLLIAVFIYGAAAMTYRSVSGTVLSGETSVRRVMRHDVPLIPPTLPMAIMAWRYLDQAPDQAYPVMEGNTLIGMITLAEAERVPRLEWGKVRVQDLMLPREKLCIVEADADIQIAMQQLERAQADHAPVYDRGQLIGMLNRRDIVYRT
jgi:Zn-dependent protease